MPCCCLLGGHAVDLEVNALIVNDAILRLSTRSRSSLSKSTTLAPVNSTRTQQTAGRGQEPLMKTKRDTCVVQCVWLNAIVCLESRGHRLTWQPNLNSLAHGHECRKHSTLCTSSSRALALVSAIQQYKAQRTRSTTSCRGESVSLFARTNAVNHMSIHDSPTHHTNVRVHSPRHSNKHEPPHCRHWSHPRHDTRLCSTTRTTNVHGSSSVSSRTWCRHTLFFHVCAVVLVPSTGNDAIVLIASSYLTSNGILSEAMTYHGATLVQRHRSP